MSENIKYEYDSSPESWQIYKKIYNSTFLVEHYNFDNLFMYNPSGKYYKNEPKSGVSNRLFSLNNNAVFVDKDKNKVMPTSRLGGEIDFNFKNMKKINFDEIVTNYNDAEMVDMLKICRELQYSYVNISLMESMGGLQQIKGRSYDRIDKLIYKLDLHFKDEKCILEKNSPSKNEEALLKYLELFKTPKKNDSIYNYCKIIYLMDKVMVDRFLELATKNINSAENLKLYMELAIDFWTNKEKKIKKLI